MKVILLFSLIIFSNASKSSEIIFFQNDTLRIIHVLDGIITEWPADKFITDKTTSIEYIVDNDDQTLFLAINIPDRDIQKRILEKGLNLYLDIKGKKRTSKGIEFPAKTETLTSLEGMKLFGFTDADPFLMSLNTLGTANVAIGWDSSYIMHIEYNIPLKMLENNLADLNNKKISIGWELKEYEMPASNNNAQRTETRLVGVSSSGNRTVSRPISNSNNTPNTSQQANVKPATIWTSYTINF